MISIHLANPKGGAPQFFFNSVYKRHRPVNNMLIFHVFTYYLFIYLLVFKANRFASSLPALNVALSLSSKFCLSGKPCVDLR